MHDKMTNLRITPPTGTARGFTLIEVLIAMLILSVGLLNLAALQATGLRNNFSAYQRSDATLMVNDILDRMRANPGADYNLALGTKPTDTSTVAGGDLNTWQTSLGASLPSGKGSIVAAGGLVTVTVQWFDKSQPGTTDAEKTVSLVVTTRI